MTLSAGARLGPYEVVSPLGAGGMGEVYRARDTRLGRDVAIKVLAAAVTSDPERLARFTSFVNAPDTADPSIAFVEERGQVRPARPDERPVIAGPVLEVVRS